MSNTPELITAESLFTGDGTWQPIEGEELSGLLSRLTVSGELPPSEVDKVRDETARILSRCLKPDGPAVVNTGLVIGRIQSGKTMSFTAVAAGARDNGYDIVIVMGGVTEILISQTRDRLSRDLALNDDRAYLRWDIYESMLSAQEADRLRSILSRRGNGGMRRTVLITLMKHHGHINSLADAIGDLDLSQVAALIIDDEADQHSLNTAIAKNEESATYRSIVRLRKQFPRHSFLQYTATPQAPLLVDLADVLSPDWTALLNPGHGYVGGATYFIERRDELIRRIPEDEAQAVERGETAPPPSFVRAFYTFLLSFAAGHPAYGGDGPTARSMLVHPHPHLWTHEFVMSWITEIWNRVSAQAQAPSGSVERDDLIRDMTAAYNDLATTVADLPALDVLIDRLAEQITGLRIQEVNSYQKAVAQSLKWNQAYGWILVGAEMLNRGFTVKGLTVTYMPRGEGVGNADTLAQRARFYGYRTNYLDHCRVYLRRSMIEAYTRLVETEERVRTDLAAHMAAQGTIKTWRRRFLLDPNLQPTRRSVAALHLVRSSGAEWFQQEYPALAVADAARNRQLASDFVGRREFSPIPHEGNWGDRQGHVRTLVPLRDATEQLLLDWHAIADDRPEFEAVLYAISEILAEDPTALAEIVLIDKPRTRTAQMASAAGRSGYPKLELMQGPSAEEATLSYPGDRNLPRDPRTKVTIQIHIVDVTYKSPPDEHFEDQQDLPLLAIRVAGGVDSWLKQVS